MEKIALPKKIEFISSDSADQKQVIIEPCYPGYGTTIGNALRRVLLSSLPGAAVVGVKIKGADHEFMAMPHIKEDVLEIILNLKQLRLKIFSQEVVKLELEARGEKEVKAKDITKNSQVEIVNPDLTLAHITDMAGSLQMDIFVSGGTGYETIESREEHSHEIGYIEMDSIFSPIMSVGISIENVRVGKMTNWEKLILTILTDGTITPEIAFYNSVEILINQFNALTKKQDQAEAVETEITKLPALELTEEKIGPAAEEVKPKKRGRPKKTN